MVVTTTPLLAETQYQLTIHLVAPLGRSSRHRLGGTARVTRKGFGWKTAQESQQGTLLMILVADPPRQARGTMLTNCVYIHVFWYISKFHS